MQQQELYQVFVLGIRNQDIQRSQAIRNRETICDLIRQTQTCYGSSTVAVRTWIREIILAYNQVDNASIIEVTWAALRDHLATQFINFDPLTRSQPQSNTLLRKLLSLKRANIEATIDQPQRSPSTATRGNRSLDRLQRDTP